MYRLLSCVISAGIFFQGLVCTADAALVGRLPATLGGADFQAYYDDQLNITWTANASISGVGIWSDQVAWAAGLNVDGVTGWRLPSFDVNGDDAVVSCSTDQAACKDNEYGHLFYYGAGTTFRGGISTASPGPFSNVESLNYWSGTVFVPNPSFAWNFHFPDAHQLALSKDNFSFFAWAVHSGDIGAAVPVPAAVWLFGSGLMGLLGVAKRKR